MDGFWLKVFLGLVDSIADNADNLIRDFFWLGTARLCSFWFLGLIELFCFSGGNCTQRDALVN